MSFIIKKIVPVFLLCFWLGTQVNAQDAQSQDSQPLVLKPVVGLGTGMMSYIGNVAPNGGTSTFQNPMSGRLGYDLDISQKLSDHSEFGLYFLYGNLSVAQRSLDANWNFQSTMAGGGIHFLYKFLPKQEVTPYAVIGIETFEYLSRVDIYASDGSEYYYWSDGSVRSLPQTSPNAASAKILQQDYNYETDVRSLNLDGSGKYTQQTFAIPFGVGLMFHIGKSADFMIGTTIHYALTDHIDGLTPQVSGNLKGSSSHDMFMMSSIGVRINLTREPQHAKKREESHRFDNITFDPNLIDDTVKPEAENNIAPSDSELQSQYDHYMDTDGAYATVVVDKFEWNHSEPAPVLVERPKPAKVVKEAPAPVVVPPPAVVAPVVTPPVVAENKTEPTEAPEGTIYKIQLLTSPVKLAEGITFAGISDKASLEVVDGQYIYSSGNFTDVNEANKYLAKLKSLGYVDAFVKTGKGKSHIHAPAPQTSSAPVKQTPAQPANSNTTQGGSNVTPTTNTGNNSGLIFKVQLGVFSGAPDDNFKSLLNQYEDVSIIKDNAGLKHYLVGSFKDLKSANEAIDQAHKAGVKAAAIMSFYNGHYISNEQALKMLKK